MDVVLISPFFLDLERSFRYLTLSEHPDHMIYDILSFFLWEGANLFFESGFVNHHNMGASGEAPAWQVSIAFSEQYIAGDICMFYLPGKGDNHNRLKLASVD